MHVDLIPTVDEIKNDDLFQKTVIIVDIFRTSSTIISALANGSQFIIPAETVGQAKMIKGNNSSYLLAGDRYYKRIPGFDLGNSPSEMENIDLKEKSIILTTSSGTRGIQKSLKGDNILIGGFLNGISCINYALSLKRDIALVAVGNGSKFGLEDGLASGFLIDLIKKEVNEDLEINEFGIAMYGSYNYYKENITEIIKGTEKAKKLIQHGLEEDVDYSMQLNKYSVCPFINSDQIIQI